jgi:hypothetical protein
MIKETITQIILRADEGKYLTNGETYGKTVIIPETACIDDWREITDKEYKSIIEEEIPVGVEATE